MDIEKKRFINQIKLFLKDIESNLPKKKSFEWYLLNNLKSYIQLINDSQSSQDIKKATKIFSRFCVESMDWDTELYKKCSSLTCAGLKLASGSDKQQA